MRTYYIDFYTKRAADKAALIWGIACLPYVQTLSSCRYQLRLLDHDCGVRSQQVIAHMKYDKEVDHGVIFTPKRNRKGN
ncbi:hypothetical protein D3C85_167070 [compost metagenome]